MDVTVVNVALPSIQSDFHTNLSTLQWVTDGYTDGSADRIGRNFRLACFGLASFLCGFRAIDRVSRKGFGSMLNPVAMSIITGIYRKLEERKWLVGLCYRDFLRHGPDYWWTDCFLF